MSINMPTTSNMRLIIIRITILLSLKASRAAEISCGMFSNDITQDILMEAAISSITIDVVETELINIEGKSFVEISP